MGWQAEPSCPVEVRRGEDPVTLIASEGRRVHVVVGAATACAVQKLASSIATWPLMIAPTPMEADGVCPRWPARRGQGQVSTTPS